MTENRSSKPIPAGLPPSLPELETFLRSHLAGSVIPFWTRHAIDPAGGINTCIRDDGSVINRDKWLWSQWRAVWVFSKLYNSLEHRQEWLDIARSIFRFTADHGWDEREQGWVLLLSGEGAVERGYESIYADGFAIYGLTELALAGGDEEPLELARKTADSVLLRLEQPHDRIPHFPYPIPKGARVQGLPMIFSQVLWELGECLDNNRYREKAVALQEEIFSRFYRPDRDLILERIAEDGSEYPPPEGSAVVPGHVIEDMWFQIHIARDRGDKELIQRAVALIRRHLELGWDAEYGGLFLAVDADGRNQVGWNHAEVKLWWPHTEALYALLLAYRCSGEKWCLEWYRKVHEYSFSHYPVPEHGEWTQRLGREGKPLEETVALPVKDPFHLPRALILSAEVLKEVNSDAQANP